MDNETFYAVYFFFETVGNSGLYVHSLNRSGNNQRSPWVMSQLPTRRLVDRSILAVAADVRKGPVGESDSTNSGIRSHGRGGTDPGAAERDH